MKGCKAIIGIVFFVMYATVCSSQTHLFNSSPRKFIFTQPYQIFTQSMASSSHIHLTRSWYSEAPATTCVFKSPVHYTAFFCKMEVKTANALGIMIKIHAGDYDKYTTGTNQPQP